MRKISGILTINPLLTRDGYEIQGWGITKYPRPPQEGYVVVICPWMNKDGQPRKNARVQPIVFIRDNPVY